MWKDSLVFFFQAEDGIRDWSVTGVQTCALPISTNGTWSLPTARSAGSPTTAPVGDSKESTTEKTMYVELHARSAFSFLDATPLPRSEERRVGKEGRSGWGAHH